MKSNRIFIGIILVAIGLFGLLQRSIAFNFTALTITVIGLAFILLYRQKKAVWALFVGAYFLCFGASGLLSWAGLSGKAGTSVGLFFIVPGVIFLVLYFDRHKHALLVPGAILLWLGLGFILASVLGFGVRATLSTLLTCVGLGLCFAYAISRSYRGRGLLYVGIITAALGALFPSGLFSRLGGFSRVAPYALIAAGAGILLASLFHKPRL